MNILTNLLKENIINALGWSLFHTLWQGMILVFLLGILLYLLRYKSAQLRYLMSVLSLISMVGLFIYNYIDHYEQISYHDKNSYSLNNNLPDEVPFIEFNDLNTMQSDQLDLSSVFVKVKKISNYFPVIVKAWFIGILFFLLKFLFAFIYTRRLKKHGILALPQSFIKQFDKIKETLNISKRIKYFESNLVKVPMVIGYFKPVILIPAEILTGMPAKQIEAIITHELAHIRRNDYMINVLQTIIETMFFFHPAVWYISSKIRDERENCCDDIAIRIHNDSIAYAKALVSIQELTLNKHYSAVAFSGRKKHLLNRIKRTIMTPKEKSNITDKLIAALLIVSALVAFSYTNAATTNDINNNTVMPASTDTPEFTETTAIKSNHKVTYEPVIQKQRIVKNDTINVHKHRSIDIDNNTVTKTYSRKNGDKQELKFTLQNGKVTELYVDGEKIDEKDYDKYQPEIDRTIEDLKDAKVDIKRAMQELEELDVEELRRNVEESMRDFHIDMEQMEVEMAKAMEKAEDVNLDKVMREVEMNLERLEDINIDIRMEDLHMDMEQIQKEMEEVRKHIRENVDFEEIRKDIEQTRKRIQEEIDSEEFQKELQRTKEELSRLNMDEIKREIEKNLQEFETYDKKETLEKMKQKLQELEQLELEEK